MKPSANLFSISYRDKIPLICTFELTQKCNLNCRHCYIAKKNIKEKNELSAKQIKDILKQLHRYGTLYLVFTGGEIFLRPDIIQLCEYASNLNFDLRLFTNGTLLDEKIIKRLSSINLAGIDISVYGMPQTHDWVTNKKGSFEKTVNSIRLLRKYNIKVTIKCPIMKANIKDYNRLKSLAKDLGTGINFDPTIAPKNDGDQSNLSQRIKTKDLKKIFVTENLVNNNKENGINCENLHTKKSLFCSAGHNLLAIDYDGNLYPCLQLPISLGDLKKTSFSDIWNDKNNILNNYRNIKFEDIKHCNQCNLISFCQRCPGLALIEDKDLFGPSKIACQMAEMKSKLNVRMLPNSEF